MITELKLQALNVARQLSERILQSKERYIKEGLMKMCNMLMN